MKRIVAPLLFLFLLTGCKEQLYTKLSERDANEIAAVLMQQGIDVDRESGKDGLITLSVSKDEFTRSVWLLENQGLPRQNFSSMADIFKGEGLIPSPMEERARFLFALGEGLSKTISEIDGVINARVHVVLPKNDPLAQEAQPSSASVFIRHYQDQPLDNRIPQIKMLVANSIDSLTYDNVSVVAFGVQRQDFRPAVAKASVMGSVTNWAMLPALGVGLLISATLTLVWTRRRNAAARLAAPSIVDVTPLAKSPASSVTS